MNYYSRLRNIKLFTTAIGKRFFAGGGSGASETNSFYSKAYQKYPYTTSAIIASILWGSGDFIAQNLEMKNQEGNIKFKSNRFIGTIIHGGVIGGIGSYIWYNKLDNFISSIFKAGMYRYHHNYHNHYDYNLIIITIIIGTKRFVFGKVSLELLVWHPISLFCYWTIVGLCEGHSLLKIKNELRKDFFITWFFDGSLWVPVDILTFWIIPLRYQVMFVNCGSLIEAIALSYIHGGASNKDHDDDLLEERTSVLALKYRIKFLDQIFATMTLRQIEEIAEEEFRRFDVKNKGYLTMKDLSNISSSNLLPGILDLKVNEKITQILCQKLDADNDGKITKDEYMRMIHCLHQSGYKKSLLIDVILAIFDKDNDNTLNRSELQDFVRVYLGVIDKEENKTFVQDLFHKYDENGDQKISKDELKNLLKQLDSGN